MSQIPLMVDLSGQRAVVVGGGTVAARKVSALLEAGASITVIAPEASAFLREQAEQGMIDWCRKLFDPGDLNEAWVVVAATDSPEVNRRVAACVQPRQLVTVVDQPRFGNFHIPARLRRGRLVLAVSTMGASPVLAKKIRDELSERYDETWEAKLDQLYQERERIKRSGWSPEEKRKRLKGLVKGL
ncbi:precorrin-2 dehydrogenase/sirohydrochlorin ferrochelatase family protein [Paludifilum halophilum]|nr:NAD(P)-dependent oxidoreductase [Paludifilum halophilum]